VQLSSPNAATQDSTSSDVAKIPMTPMPLQTIMLRKEHALHAPTSLQIRRTLQMRPRCTPIPAAGHAIPVTLYLVLGLRQHVLPPPAHPQQTPTQMFQDPTPLARISANQGILALLTPSPPTSANRAASVRNLRASE
jgi:hypothetical protein